MFKLLLGKFLQWIFYKAAIQKVEEIEGRYALLGDAGVSDVTGQETLMTGTLPEEIYKYNLTTVVASGQYTFEFVEVVDPSTL